MNPGNILSSDSVFVEFEREPICHPSYAPNGQCFVIGYGDYLEIIPSHTIAGDEQYTITGSEEINWRDRVSSIGAVSGQLDTIVFSGHYYHNTPISNPWDPNGSIELDDVVILYSASQDGDSGGPIITRANSDNEASITSTISGSIQINNSMRTFGYSWNDIADDLDIDDDVFE